MSSEYLWIEEILSAQCVKQELVQELWSGYGKLLRIHLSNGSSVVLKEIDFPSIQDHPRGWSTNISDERKRKSYRIEQNWYEGLAKMLDDRTKVPSLIHIQEGGALSLLLEDLNTAGFDQRHSSLDLIGIKKVLQWLARFHASFLGIEQDDLWPIGTYWHLDTRPDEYEIMESGWLKENAKHIDEVLNNAKYKTIVHGDAKLANFCFSKSLDVAAVDFQYVGGGCGMKDVAYFLSSCMNSDELNRLESELLDCYFKELRKFIPDEVTHELEEEWRMMYPVAWADFVRFLKGWAPDHYKLNEYSLHNVQLTRRLLDS